MDGPASILGAMRAAVPCGRAHLDPGETRVLADLTRRLVEARPAAHQEFQRFQAVRDRGIALPREAAAQWIGGRAVLVTGGTGCIGSMLMEQLSALRPARLVSVSRGVTAPWRQLPGARYITADIRDRGELAGVFDEVGPQIVFHLAAQRNPGLAEVEVHRTVTTNVFGTRNVLEISAERGVSDIVCASTGKALRPYSPDVYAASKRAAEWLMARAAPRGTARISAARFTHVVDNSIIAERLRRWCKSGVIRLHGTDIDFYVQSALESAQLLLGAGLGARAGTLRMHALRDLDWPVNLLDLALGMIAETRSGSPIYIAGYESGYEESAFPGLYDPRTAGDISPLINAFEAPAIVAGPCGEIDAFEAPAPSGDAGAVGALARLERACAAGAGPAAIRGSFEVLCSALLDGTLRDVPRPALLRAIEISTAYDGGAAPAHPRLLGALHRWAG